MAIEGVMVRLCQCDGDQCEIQPPAYPIEANVTLQGTSFAIYFE
jgi:hypothetical protein